MRLTGFPSLILFPNKVSVSPWRYFDSLGRRGTFRLRISNVCCVEDDICVDKIANFEIFELDWDLAHCQAIAGRIVVSQWTLS